MSRYLREGCAALLLLSALVLIGIGVQHLRDQEFVGAVLLALTGLTLVRAGVDLLRPSMGE
jgi:4-amino-4-deoxy-L-arabinose transferase-like glycosyltransferase